MHLARRRLAKKLNNDYPVLIHSKHYSQDQKKYLYAFYLLDLPNQKSERLTDPVFTKLKEPAFCLLNSHAYFICGGRDDPDKDTLSLKAYVYDVSIRRLTQAPDMPFGMKNMQSVCSGDLIYVIGTVPKPGNLLHSNSTADINDEVLTGLTFSLQSGSWSPLSSTSSGAVNFWPLSVFIYKNLLVMTGQRNQSVEFDLTAGKWNDADTFVHEFDTFWVTKSGRCLLFHGYHNAIMDYDYPTDTITMMNTFDEIGYADSVVYFPEYDLTLLKQQDVKGGYFLLDDKTNQIETYGADDSKKIFGDDMGFITAASNQVLNAPSRLEDGFIEINGDAFKDRAYIFGNWFQPLQIDICFTPGQESATVERIPENLFLKIEQGIIPLDESRLLLAGGYADDYSTFPSNDTQIYNIETKQTTDLPNLSADYMGVHLKKITPTTLFGQPGFWDKYGLFGKPKVPSLSDPNVYNVMMVDNGDNYELWNSQTQAWSAQPKSNFQDIPTFLDTDDAVILYNVEQGDKGDVSSLVFQQFNPQDNTFAQIYKQPFTFDFAVDYNIRIAKDQYLVIVTKKKNKKEVQTFAKMTLTWSGSNISTITLDLLEDFDSQSVWGIKHFLVGRIVFFMWVVSREQFGYKFFDLDQLKTVSNDSLAKVGGLFLAPSTRLACALQRAALVNFQSYTVLEINKPCLVIDIRKLKIKNLRLMWFKSAYY